MNKLITYLILLISFHSQAEYPPAVHYAFGNYLGSGVYDVSGNQAFLMEIPFSYHLSDDENGLKLRLPINLGIYDWSISDGRAPNSLSTLSFIPGIEFTKFINENWSITPFFDIGYAREFDAGEDTLVTAFGAALKYQFGPQNQHCWINRLTYAKARSEIDNSESTLTFWQTGADFLTPFKGSFVGYDFQLATYAMTRIYFDNFSLEADKPGKDVDVRKTFEGGFSLKLKEPCRFSLLEIGRIGIGYQFGDGFDLYKVFVNLAI
jgi:hypothetical protein